MLSYPLWQKDDLRWSIMLLFLNSPSVLCWLEPFQTSNYFVQDAKLSLFLVFMFFMSNFFSWLSTYRPSSPYRWMTPDTWMWQWSACMMCFQVKVRVIQTQHVEYEIYFVMFYMFFQHFNTNISSTVLDVSQSPTIAINCRGFTFIPWQRKLPNVLHTPQQLLLWALNVCVWWRNRPMRRLHPSSLVTSKLQVFLLPIKIHKTKDSAHRF